jgi:uncharacterized membrane protein HdeD (DUF308 family)
MNSSILSNTMSRMWWSLALRGVFALLSGITSIIAAVRAGEDHQRWGWFLVSGIAGIAAALVSFVWPGITALALV